jgi:sugar-specific transcriptional regulator TrmB
MTTMELTDFLKLGFNKNEAKVYMSLIKFGKASANLLIKDTKFHKNIVYDNIEKLIDKGLVTFILEGGRKIFFISSPNSILDYIEEKENEIAEKRKLALSISHQIQLVKKKMPEKQEATIYRGLKAVRSFYSETLNKGDYSVFGAPQKSIDRMGEAFWYNYSLKRQKLKLNVRMIFNLSIKNYGEKLKNRYTEIKYFNRDFEPKTETHIQGNIVAIIVWTEEPIIFRMDNKEVADSYKEFFDEMWKNAKK